LKENCIPYSKDTFKKGIQFLNSGLKRPGTSQIVYPGDEKLPAKVYTCKKEPLFHV